MIKLGGLSFNLGAWRCRSIALGSNADGELLFELEEAFEVEEEEVEEVERFWLWEKGVAGLWKGNEVELALDVREKR
jgi:hypothetical protein